MEGSDKKKSLLRRAMGGTAAKACLVILIILLLEIPMVRVSGLITERERRSMMVTEEIRNLWGGNQVIAGPVLLIPFVTRRRESVRVWSEDIKDYVTREREIVTDHTLSVLPEKLSIDGGLEIQKRYRGIYETPVYQASVKISGRFGEPDFMGLKALPEDIDWKRAQVWLGVSDLRGIRKTVSLSWNGKSCEMQPDLRPGGMSMPGMAALPGISGGRADQSFSLALTVDGSGDLFFSPAGRSTDVSLSSAWPHPSFTGAFLPYDRDVTDKGFKARWNILEINRSLARCGLDEAPKLAAYAFGVKIISPVNVYVMASRAAKYGIVFIALTFFALFVSELMARVRLHPVQYLMAGLAVVVFYALLLSLSEHIGFQISYGAAAAAVTLLIGIYASGALGKKALALLVAGVLALLYGYWYVLLQMEDYALVFGCVGLFLLLAAAMLGTRRVDWNALDSRLSGKIESRNPAETKTLRTDDN